MYAFLTVVPVLRSAKLKHVDHQSVFLPNDANGCMNANTLLIMQWQMATSLIIVEVTRSSQSKGIRSTAGRFHAVSYFNSFFQHVV